MPAIGYDHPDQSHFNSRHFYEVGALDPRLVTGWLGPAARPRSARPTTRSRESRWTAIWRRRWRPPRAGRRARRPRLQLLVARRVGRGRGLDAGGVPAVGAPHAGGRDAGDARGRLRVGAGRRLRQQLTPVPLRRRKPAYTSPVAYPKGEDNDVRASGSRASRRCSAAGLPIRCVAISAPGEYDTHDNQPEALSKGLKATADEPARLPARPRGARHRGPRADPGLVGVRPPRRGERLGGHRPRRRRARHADRHARQRPDGRRVPRPRRSSTPTATCACTSDFRAVYSGLLEQWFGTDAAAVIPDAKRFGRPALVR